MNETQYFEQFTGDVKSYVVKSRKTLLYRTHDITDALEELDYVKKDAEYRGEDWHIRKEIERDGQFGRID